MLTRPEYILTDEASALMRSGVIRAMDERSTEASVDWVFRLVAAIRTYRGGNNVYFIEAQSTNLIKIGRSINPYRRLAQLRLLSPVRLDIVGAIPGDSRLEAILHEGFEHLRSHGEWFYATSRLRGVIPVLCGISS